MQPRVIAVLVALNGARYLPRTLAALAAQTRRPDATIYVDAGSTDTSAALMAEVGSGHVETTPGRRSFGGAVAHAMLVSPPADSDNEWMWLLGHDNAPEPTALAALLGAVEVAPSVAIAGPKLMRLDEPDVIASFGETLTAYGRSVSLVDGELDQAQHDIQSDHLGVAAGGMLVRRTVFAALGGFDRALPSADAALDFAVRARLAGHRVVGVPTARVTSAGPPELFGKRSLSVGAQNHIRRFAQLHRRLAWAPAAAVPVHWLALLPLAVLRSLGHLIAKRPGAVGGELAAALRASFDGSIPAARSNIRRNRTMGWAAVDALRLSWSDVRERRSSERSAAAARYTTIRERPGFFVSGGPWVMLLAALAGVIAFGRFVDAQALAGGGLLPLSTSVGELWSHVGYGWHDIASGFIGAADPFATVLALLGSLTFWAPSLSIVLLYLAALPLAALTAWFCAARISERIWPPAIAAIAWAVAPPFLASLSGGHLGAVIAHILLPTLVLAVVNAARNWSMAALAALLFAAVVASAPILAPALVLGLVAWIVAHPRGVLRIIGIPIPAAALFAPLVVEQLARGNWLALFAEPGIPVLGAVPTALHLALGESATGLLGWEAFLAPLGLPGGIAPIVVVALLVPLGILAVLSLFLPGTRRSVPAMAMALLGFATAVVASQLMVTMVGSQTTPIWAAPALSLYWLGLTGAMVVTLDVIRRAATAPALIAAVTLVTLAVPALTVAATDAMDVTASNGRLLPAFASAEAANRAELGTLQITAQPGGGVATTLHRGLGTTLDEQSTLASTDNSLSETDDRLATLAGNLASRSGFDIAGELDSLQIAFVLVPNVTDDSAASTRQRVADALDGNRLLTPIGSTANGFLWNYGDLAEGEAPTGPGPLGTQLGVWIIIGQAVVFGLTLLLAIPTTRRRRVRAARADAVTSDLDITEEVSA
ncbi:glycosyltransferase family 2 protein [Salinibacterium sp. G-O1]|uniref:glycosyltransferase family 2 protein n=1 Tax=Salinibacterium sp. G-O1 TaxID=3046208 RepID=UPI0024BBB813|nr:glycosyltransferase family 2 protein [Salinibacterium sp. G-O1]MDJ0336541.1 glycosyltransferase family 2 protein [Salinibacterium sp. G-O1]